MFSKIEIRRQSTHLFLGCIIVSLLYAGWINAWWLLMGSMITLLGSYLTKKGVKIPLVKTLLNLLGRETENKNMPAKGLIFYLLGSGLTALFYPQEIALASIMILAFGDSISRILGPRGYIKHPFNNNRFLEGILVGTIFATLAGMLFVPFMYSVYASVVTMFIEGMDIEVNNVKIDDNLLIPVLSGALMMLLHSL